LGLDNKQIILNMCLEDVDDFIHDNDDRWPRFISKMIPWNFFLFKKIKLFIFFI